MSYRVPESELPDFSEPDYVRYLRAAAPILRNLHDKETKLQQQIGGEALSADIDDLVRRAKSEHVAYEAALMVAREYEKSGEDPPSALQTFCTAAATGELPKPSRPKGRPKNTVRDRIIANAVCKASREQQTINENGSITPQQSRAEYANGNKPINPTACDLVAEALQKIVAEGENIYGLALSAKEVHTIWRNSDLKKAEK